jgi:hypothetical protein
MVYFLDKIGSFWDLEGQVIIGMNRKGCLCEGLRPLVRIF